MQILVLTFLFIFLNVAVELWLSGGLATVNDEVM